MIAKVAETGNKYELVGDLAKSCYLNVVYKVRQMAYILAIFATDLHSSEVDFWDDLIRGK